MKCEKITILNFCQHRFIEHQFVDGLTAIIGSNGSGKSNFLGAIRFAITGENPNVGAKLANINDLAPPTENSYVELIFSHASVRATVRRNLRPAKPTAVLTVEGGETINGDKAVTAKIVEILGISTDIINDIVIVAQNDIFGFLDRAPAKRAEQFQRLFHTETAAVVHRIIGDQLKTVDIPSVGVDLDVLRQAVAQHTEQERALVASLEQHPTFDEITEGREANAKVVRDFNERGLQQRQIDETAAQQATLITLKESAAAQRQSVAKERGTIQLALDGNLEAAESARDILANLTSRRRTNEARHQAEQAVARHTLTLTNLTEPPKPENICNVQDAETRLIQQTADSQNLKRFIDSFADGVAECPTCGTPTDTLRDKLASANTTYIDLVDASAKLRLARDASRDYASAMQVYNSNNVSATTAKRQATDALSALPSAEDTAVDEIQLQQTVANQATYEAGLGEYNNTIQQIDQRIAGTNGQLKTIEQNLTSWQLRLDELPDYAASQRTEAETNVTAWDNAAATRRQGEQQLAISSTSKAEGEQQIAQAETVEAEATLLRGWDEFAQELRGVVHKDAAPRFVAQRNLARLEVGINESLQLFDTPYRVQADEGLSFVVSFNNGSRQPAERLSEGQKVVLALAFRLALNLMFAENVGALYLDEPTAYLDDHHIRAFEPVLAQLRDLSAARGLQCIIITHERDLAPLFDSVVQL